MAETATAQRPRTRGDCVDGPRPCPWVSCKHHLMLDVSPKTGHIRYNFDSLEEMAASCSLDVADQGEHTESQVAQLIGLSQTGVSKAARRGAERARVVRLPVVA